MRRSVAMLVVLGVAALVPAAAPASRPTANRTAGAAGPGADEPALSTRDWRALERRHDLRRERAARERGDHSLPAARPEVETESVLPPPKAGQPKTARWSGTLTFNPESPLAGPQRGAAPCAEPECEQFDLTVPDEARALYVKVAWERADFGIYLYAFEPGCGDDVRECKQHGMDIQDRGPELDKRPGNSTTLPVSELSVADPKPGVWRIRARASWGLDIEYAAVATVTREPLIEWPREDPIRLSRYATHRIPINIVLAGTTLDDEQLEQVRAGLPDQYHLPVLWWEFADSGPGDSDTDEEDNCYGLVNWTRCHYGGTYSEDERKNGGSVPFFEPVKMEYEYHFIEADERFTRAAFAEMKRLTKQRQEYHDSAQTAYLLGYNATQGRFREPAVADPTRVDMIDAVAFEDWLFEGRDRFCDNFRDLETGKVHGGGFIAPDESARYDPYYETGGRSLARAPQGRNEGETIFFFDTYSPSYAKEYFDPTRYHNFSTMNRFKDPDTGAWDGIDYGRLWGGRYRFAFIDLGAAPNYQESTAWPNGRGGGSADPPRGDPPVWEYRSNPAFKGRFEERAIARNITTLVFSRMTSGFLYRPIPRDVYQLTTTNVSDYYSRPPHGAWFTDLTKIYSEEKAARWLSAAIPYATFRSGEQIPRFEPYRYPGCSDVHVGSKSSVTGQAVMLPDPSCAGKEPDPLQRTIELAKAQGDDVAGAGIPFEQAVSASVMRTYWEKNRETYAPVGPGTYSFILINAVFEKAYTWYLPAIVGGVAFNTPHRESWGQLQNRNDRTKPVEAHDCGKSAPAAPGCDGVPPVPTHRTAGGLTYTVEHEASHALGLLHPHDFLGVDKNAKGEWSYYYETLVWMPDSTQSPTTYFASIYPYGVWDQDNLQRGHAGEYIRMAQDAIADAYLEAGRRGVSGIGEAPDVVRRRDRMQRYLERGRRLFADGDYLNAEYAFKNAYLAASGVTGAEVEPRELRPGERVLFRTDRQPGPTRAQALGRCTAAGGARVLGESLTRARPLPATGMPAAVLVSLAALLLMSGAAVGRWAWRGWRA